VFTRYQKAMLDKSADDLADLYAVDAVHEFPFRFGDMPERYQSRDEIRASYKANWNGTPVQVDEIHDVVVYESTDPEVIMGEWGGTGTLTTSGGPITLNGVVMLRVRGGLIVECRDYMNGAALIEQLGRLPSIR
jgi:ketosteroid isomerase-like protein